MIHMKCLIFFSDKYKKKMKILSATVVINTLRVNAEMGWVEMMVWGVVLLHPLCTFLF